MADDRDRSELLKPLPLTRPLSTARPAEADVLWPSFTDPYEAAGTREGEIPCFALVMGKDGLKPGATAYYVVQYVHLSLGEVGFTASGDQWFSYLYNDRPARRLWVEGTAAAHLPPDRRRTAVRGFDWPTGVSGQRMGPQAISRSSRRS